MEDGPNNMGPGPWGPGGPPGGGRNDGPDNGRPPPFGVDRCVSFRYVGHLFENRNEPAQIS